MSSHHCQHHTIVTECQCTPYQKQWIKDMINHNGDGWRPLGPKRKSQIHMMLYDSEAGGESFVTQEG